jgi:hypothetical protein
LLTSSPLETADGAWLAAAAVAPQAGKSPWVILRSLDAARIWRPIAYGPEGMALAEPSLAVARDGRWVVAGRQPGGAVVAVFSKDQGTSWSSPKLMNLTGARPEIVELLETLFIVIAEGASGELLAAFTWDDLDFSIPRPLACGSCLRTGGRKTLARGSGVDMAARFNNLAQVPLEADIEIPFEGRAVGLVHDVMPGGRLVGVLIDGREYPPIDMSGPARTV